MFNLKRLYAGVFLSGLVGFSSVNAADMSQLISSDDQTFSITKPVNMVWYPQEIMKNQYIIKLDNSTIENHDRGSFHITAQPVDKGLDTMVLNNSLIGSENCDEHSVSVISGFNADEYTCFSLEKDTNALREWRNIYLQANDRLYIITLDYGRSAQDKTLIDSLRNTLKIVNSGNRLTNNIVSVENTPKIDLHVNNNWTVYTPQTTEDYSVPIMGFNKNGAIDSFFFTYYKSEEKSANATKYLENIGSVLNGGPFKNNVIHSIDRDDNFLLNSRIGKGIRVVRKNTPKVFFRGGDKALMVYDVMYFIRDQGDYDVMVTYSFTVKDSVTALNKIKSFENDIINQISFSRKALIIDNNASLTGALKRSTSNSAVYLIKDNKRYVFPNYGIFTSWFNDFSSVGIISDSEMASYRLAGNIIFKPGTLIKIPTNPKVYVVERNNIIRWVTSEEIAIKHFGVGWAKKVKDVGVSEFTNYVEGEEIR